MTADGRERRKVADEGQEYGRYVMSVAVSLTGVDAYRIRRYEAAGLLSPMRTKGGKRLFSDRDITRIREVKRLEGEGINLKGIEVIFSMSEGRRGDGNDI